MKGFALSLWENFSQVLTYFDQFTFTLAQLNPSRIGMVVRNIDLNVRVLNLNS